MNQRQIVVKLLRESGPKGMTAREFIYDHGITRAAAIIFELRNDDPPFDIETVDEGWLPDGRRRTARYILKEARVEEKPKPPPGMFDVAPQPGRPLHFACGCIRAADGKAWELRCDSHSGRVIREREELPW